jgi:hypothetical protein
MRYRHALTAAALASTPAIVIPLVALGLALSSRHDCGSSVQSGAWTLAWIGFALIVVAVVTDIAMLVVGRGMRRGIGLVLILAAASLVPVGYALVNSFEFCFDISF